MDKKCYVCKKNFTNYFHAKKVQFLHKPHNNTWNEEFVCSFDCTKWTKNHRYGYPGKYVKNESGATTYMPLGGQGFSEESGAPNGFYAHDWDLFEKEFTL